MAYFNLGEHLFNDGIYAEKLSEPILKSVIIPPGIPILFYSFQSLGGIYTILVIQIICQLVVCYYLLKLAQSSGLEMPKCNPL